MAKVIVVYGGGFQPFHAGHLSSYLEAKQAFPNADFYVAASNDTKTRPIPFNDKQFLAQQAGVSDPFVQVVAPINPKEILDRYSPKQDIFILVRSERDPVGYTKKDGSPGYFQPFTSLDKCEPFGYHGYVFVTHKKEFKLNGQVVYSGTQVRDMYANSDDKGRQLIVKQLYPQSGQQDTIKQMLDKYIGSIETTPVKVAKPKTSAIKQLKANKLKEQIQRMRPLIREASIEQKYKFLKLMKEATQLNELNLFGKKPDKLAQKTTSADDYRAYFNRPEPATVKRMGKVYSNPQEYYAATKKDPMSVKKPVREFALPGDDGSGDDGFDDETLKRLAAQWWQGDEDPRVERTLAASGWEIGQDEGYDNGGVFVVRAGDINGNSYMSWPSEDLVLDEGPTSDMRDFFKTQQPLNPAPIMPTTTGPTIATVTRQNEDSLNEISDEKLQSYLSTAGKQVGNRLARMSQARDRLNKNYEIYYADDPAKIADRFQANTPDEARNYYYKYIKNFISDVDFDLRLRRSTGLIEEVNKDFLYNGTPIDQKIKMNGYVFRVQSWLSGFDDTPGIVIKAYDPKLPKNEQLIGGADFELHQSKSKQWVESSDTEVDDRYRGKGIATMMYAVIKSLGFDIQPSMYQSTAGKEMWGKWGSDAENLMREDKESKIVNVVIDFYKPVINDIHKEKVDNYVAHARELMQKAPDNATRKKLIDIFKTGKDNPYLQGGIITTVAALLAGGVLSTSHNLGLNPAQTNLALQAILNTVIPTIVSRVNGKNWMDTLKYTLASAGVGTGIAGAGLVEENPNQQLALYKSDGKTYRGSRNKMPTLDNPDDIYNKADRYDFDDTDELPDELIDEPNMDDSIKELIKSKLDELEPRERKILQLRFWHDMTLADIADRLNVTPAWVRHIEARALRKIKTSTLDYNADSIKMYVPESIDYIEEK